MDLSFGFGKHKEKHDANQTEEVKKATISDTQMNSLNTNDSASQTPNSFSEQGMQNPAESQAQNSNFVNPFANQNQQNFGNLGNIDNSLNNMQTEQNNFNPSFNQQESPNQGQGQEQQQMQNPAEQQQTQPQQTQNQFQQFNENSFQNANANPGVTKMSKDEIIEMIDETVEKIIEDKWNELIGDINKIGKWKDKTESVIEMLKEDIVAIRDGFGKLESKILNKISSYDKDILDVNSEIKALEKVFQKITPTLINNVNELSKIANEFKGVKDVNKDKISVDEDEDNYVKPTEDEDNSDENNNAEEKTRSY